jgi:hypothetical protein
VSTSRKLAQRTPCTHEIALTERHLMVRRAPFHVPTRVSARLST